MTCCLCKKFLSLRLSDEALNKFDKLANKVYHPLSLIDQLTELIWQKGFLPGVESIRGSSDGYW